MPCFLGGVGGGGNRTRVRNNVQFKSFTGLSGLLSQARKDRRCTLRLPSCCAPPPKRVSYFDFLFSLESTSYSLLDTGLNEDPANYAARAIDWK